MGKPSILVIQLMYQRVPALKWNPLGAFEREWKSKLGVATKMRKKVVWMNTMAIMLVLALMVTAVPVGADDGLRSGYSKVRDWDNGGEAFSFTHAIADDSLYGGAVTYGGDFFM